MKSPERRLPIFVFPPRNAMICGHLGIATLAWSTDYSHHCRPTELTTLTLERLSRESQLRTEYCIGFGQDIVSLECIAHKVVSCDKNATPLTGGRLDPPS
jgi:hypothetical protein